MGMAKRGPRERALQSSPAIFAGALGYNPTAGIPTGAGVSDGKYHDPAEAARSRPGPPAVQPSPLKVRSE